MNNQVIGKVPDAGKDREQKEKRRQGMRQLDGITDSMDMNLGGLACCSLWGCKELDTTGRLNIHDFIAYVCTEVELIL